MVLPAGAPLYDWGLPPTVPFLNWAWDDLLFLLLAGIMLGAAIFVVIGRDIVRSGLSMILAFAALAGIYVLAGAVVVAAAQVLIYIGAISVLILFAIMLTQTKAGPAQLVFHHQAWAGALAAVGLAFLLVTAVINTQWPLQVALRLHSDTKAVAMLLFSDGLYVFSLQVVAVLLTAAVIGAVFLAKREDVPDPGEAEPMQLRVRPPLAASPVDQP
ncbi:MAG: NADH-quinone oxidoreductase subunit J family protein [Candidatus Limnocylindrales bacterium]